MNEKKKHKIMLGIEVVLLCMIVAILGTNAASSNPPSNGVSYNKNSQTTVEGALNDLYNKANYGNASASQILKDKTALVGGKKVTGTMPTYGSSVASSVVPWNGSVYFRMPIGYYEEACCGTAEVAATNADVASAIGLTAGKLLKGESVLGITGTGETSCPSCPDCPTCPTCEKCPTPESQGYWKVYKFENTKLTTSGRVLSDTWKTAGIEECKNNACSTELLEFSTNLNFTASEILGGEVLFTPGDNSDMRISRHKSEAGGADKTDSAYYPSLGWNVDGGKGIRLFISNAPDRRFQFSTKADRYLGSLYDMIVLATSGKLKISFNVNMNSSSGKAYSPYEFKGTEFYVSGYIIYK